MTSPYYSGIGVPHKIESECRECIRRREFHVGNIDAVLLICENEESEHFGHVMAPHHPACEEFETVYLTEIGEEVLNDTEKEKSK